MRVEFKLTMPGVGSWDGRWSGSGRNYVLYRNVPSETVTGWGTMSWHHNFGDGWCARIDARVLEKGERRKGSEGFCGYDWMVRNIIRWGSTWCQCEFRTLPAERAKTYGDGEWESCIYCGTVKKFEALQEVSDARDS